MVHQAKWQRMGREQYLNITMITHAKKLIADGYEFREICVLSLRYYQTKITST